MEKNTIVKPVITSNYFDKFAYPFVYLILPFVVKIKFLTPNVITILSFLSFAVGSVFLFVDVNYREYVAALLIIMGYVGDDLDGQVARARNLSSAIGNFLDKVLDVLKIFIISMSAGYAAYLQTENIIYIFMASAICFFFNLRYYIKLETMFSQMEIDKNYLENSLVARKEFLLQHDQKLIQLKNTYKGRVKAFWEENKTFFAVDEAEIAVLIAIFAIAHMIPLGVLVLCFAQIIISFVRFYERGKQVSSDTKSLLIPLRK
jgi:phosphatidylglycerophosphate synthase